MTTYHNAEPDDEEDDAAADRNSRGFFAKLRDAWMRNGDDDEEFDEEDEENVIGVAAIPSPIRSSGGSSTPIKRGNGALRLETVRRSRITVRRTVQSFEDVRRAVDGLREGTQQIINLEQTPADMSERLIDFMNGATYSIDGTVEKIGDQVYLFTPTNVIVDVEDKPMSANRTAFFDRE
jgi:cell division inhibitor SepF